MMTKIPIIDDINVGMSESMLKFVLTPLPARCDRYIMIAI